MEHRYVTVHKPVNVAVGESATEWTFQKFIADRTADATAFGGNLDGIEAALAIRNAFAKAEADSVVAIELGHWESLCAAIRKPTGGYLVEVMLQLMPHAKAVLDAPSTAPTVATDPQ